MEALLNLKANLSVFNDHKTAKWRAILSVFLLIFLSQNAFAIDLPAHLTAKKAAVVLGLEREQSLKPETVKAAAKTLLMKYHPDVNPKMAELSKINNKLVGDIIASITNAKNSLLDILKADPWYDPSKDTQPSKDAYTSATQSDNYGDSNFTWSDFKKEAKTKHHRPKRDFNNPFGLSLGATISNSIFSSLLKDGPFKMAIIPFKRTSPDTHNPDMMMIIDPDIFPRIELRFVSRTTSTGAPQIIKSVMATYVRDHHLGAAPPAPGDDYDGIVFDNGNYLFKAFRTGQPLRPFFGKPMDDNGDVLWVQATNHFMFIELNAAGYSRGINTTYEIIKDKQPEDFLPLTEAAAKKLKKALPRISCEEEVK